MAKAKKIAKTKKVKKAVKTLSKKNKKSAVKKSPQKMTVKKNTEKKKTVAAKRADIKPVRKSAEKNKTLSVKEERAAKKQEAHSGSSVATGPGLKTEKEKKKTKEEIAEEKELLGEETYSWDSGTFSDMKNYEPTPVFRKPDPPQPKFKGKKDNRTRYSDKELEEFRSIINEKIEESEKDYELLKNTLAHKDEHGTDDTSPTFKVLEDGSDAMSREEIAQLASRQEKHIQNLKNALIRIENKTYGICRVTGKLIPKERLRSVPHATLSIEAKLIQNS
jgi:DnaK suppressor protein